MSDGGYRKPISHDSFRARLARLASPGYGYCGRCGMPWNRVEPHVTHYSRSRGCFPLCEGCWTRLGSPEARIEYYMELVDQWEAQGSEVDADRRGSIARAVAAELVTVVPGELEVSDG